MVFPAQSCTSLSRGGVAVTGPDAATFLQGLITNDIYALPAARLLYAALLTPQGRFLHDFFVAPLPDGFLLEGENGARRDDLLTRLTTYRLRADVSIAPVEVAVMVGVGNVGEVPTLPGDIIVAADPRHPHLGWRAVRVGAETLPVPDGYTKQSLATYDRHRIVLGIPDGIRDAALGTSTLEELNFPRLNGVSFTKGCYVGQELTARMEHRALAKKHLYPVTLNMGDFGETEHQHNDIYADDHVIGILRSRCSDQGLALLRDDAIKADTRGIAPIVLQAIENGFALVV